MYLNVWLNFLCNIVLQNIEHHIVYDVELRSICTEVLVGGSKVIVCIASVTSCCKFFGRVFISFGYSSKFKPVKKKIFIVHLLMCITSTYCQ